jgi:arylsulfatase A-like enzyme
MSKSGEGSSMRDPANGMTRRTFLKGAAMAAAAVGAARILSVGPPAQAGERTAGLPGLNILVIMVDEMRAPSVYLSQANREAYLPNLTRLANEGVDFTNHHIASTACVASRATMVTGLYTHQTAMFGGTIGPDLNTGFPTYGTILRDVGYDTFWFGKWHLCFDKDRCPPDPYESYGFTALPGEGTCPDPWGGVYEGQRTDPVIRQQFVDWLAARPANGAPWCATVSLVNPHDAGLYPNGTRFLEAVAPHVFDSMPANFETARDRINEHKPAAQQQLADIVNLVFGELPDSGIPAEPWIRLLDTYLLTEQLVDTEIGLVLEALEQSPFAQDTIVIFTSDHGDYTGAHGLRGKGYGMYEESILVPLIVKDPTGTWTAGRNVTRSQLSSHVDLVPLLLTLATGSERWREEPQFEHLATRLSLAKILADPHVAGRPYAAFTTDEPSLAKSLGDFFDVGGEEFEPVPDHIMGVCMPGGKFAQYAYWQQPRTTHPVRQGMEFEAYDYRTPGGQLELHNSYGSNLPGDREVVKEGQQTLDHAIEHELEAPLPPHLRPVREQALRDWFKVYKETGPRKPKEG